MNDGEIVELYLRRDESAIDQTSIKYGARLRGLARGIVGDEETAKECENDTFLEAWNRIPPHEPKDYLYAFLARITRHIALNRCRECGRLKRSAFITELSLEMEQCISAPDDTAGQVEEILLGEAISRYLKAQPEQKRNIFLRRYFFLDSIEDIAGRFKLSKEKVKSTLFRSRRELKAYLEKEGYRL